MRTAILLAGLLVSSELEHIRSKPLTKAEQELDTKFSKIYAFALMAAMVMDIGEFLIILTK